MKASIPRWEARPLQTPTTNRPSLRRSNRVGPVRSTGSHTLITSIVTLFRAHRIRGTPWHLLRVGSGVSRMCRRSEVGEHGDMKEDRLTRVRDGRIVAGVCTGLA